LFAIGSVSCGDMSTSEILGLLIAALGGSAVGLERQWSGHAEGPRARFAGIRTFTMLGALAGLCGWLWKTGLTVPAAILFAGAVTITAAAYVAASRQDVDATTEVAALVVLAAGLLAGTGAFRLASAIIALEALLLVEKSRLHALVQRIDDVELRAGVRFAVMACVVLPLLPKGPYGPLGGIRPRELWALVLFFSALSFLGHVGRRLVGPGQGYLVTGLIGGLVSSTNVTFTFARLSRSDPAMQRALAFGAVGANAVLYPRVLAATAVLNPALVPSLIPYLAMPALVAALTAAIGQRRPAAAGAPDLPQDNPLQLRAAMQMAVLFQGVIMLVSFARETWGQSGVLTSAAILGLTDVDALTVSMAREVAKTVSLEVAALAIAVGVLANTALKLGVALLFGGSRFRTIVGGTLVLMILTAGAALILR
jgi:uncharacterized membrane protein (DUF4010 family)